MLTCPKGAIVNSKEITLLILALNEAIDMAQLSGEAELPMRRSWDTREDRKRRAELAATVQRFRVLRNKLKRSVKSADKSPRSSALKGS